MTSMTADHTTVALSRRKRRRSKGTAFTWAQVSEATLSQKDNRNHGSDLDHEMTGGECLRLSLSDMVEWNLLKGLAEDVLAGKRSMTDKEIEKVREEYGLRR